MYLENDEIRVEKEKLDYVAAISEKEAKKFLVDVLTESASYETRKANTMLITPELNAGNVIASVSMGKTAPIKLRQVLAFKSNFRSRCGCDSIGSCNSESHGTAYADVDYNYGINNRGKYDIIVRINHYGLNYYTKDPNKAWIRFRDAPISYHLWSSSKLSGPGNPGRGGYFQNGNNNTPGEHTGTLGVEVYEPTSNRQIWWGLWYFDDGWGDWGNQWLRCGHTYNFWFEDM